MRIRTQNPRRQVALSCGAQVEEIERMKDAVIPRLVGIIAANVYREGRDGSRRVFRCCQRVTIHGL